MPARDIRNVRDGACKCDEAFTASAFFALSFVCLDLSSAEKYEINLGIASLLLDMVSIGERARRGANYLRFGRTMETSRSVD